MKTIGIIQEGGFLEVSETKAEDVYFILRDALRLIEGDCERSTLSSGCFGYVALRDDIHNYKRQPCDKCIARAALQRAGLNNA